MKKILAIMLLPLLMVLPISEVCKAYFKSQNCELLPVLHEEQCNCEGMHSQTSIYQNDSCCCENQNHQDKESLPLLLDIKILELNLVANFDFSNPINLAKKINIIKDYSIYYSAGISTSETNVYYSPPIYQQICSLRI